MEQRNSKIIHTQRVLSQTQITLGDYTINPYRGCDFGCIYCYSKENKNIKGKNFSGVGLKINADEILKKELLHEKPERVVLGSTTECFQHHNRKHKITEKLLETLNENNIPYTILTKSHFIKDSLDLIGKNKKNKIYFTFNFHSDEIARIFELNSSPIQKRLMTIDEIIKKKIPLRIHAGPFIPYISRLDEILKILPQGLEELDIEMYHKKQGNFREVLEKTKENLGNKTKENLELVYKTKENYLDFMDRLQERIKNLDALKKIKTFLIVPDFDRFYDSRIRYETALG